MSKKFIRQILKGEKKLLPIKKMIPTILPVHNNVKETYLINLINMIKNDEELLN
jgi:hypothetical protein